MNFSLTEQPLDPSALRASLFSVSSGAYCHYEGWVRETNEGKSVRSLTYSAYAELAPSVAESILAEAKAKFQLDGASVVHRTGSLVPGDIAVWVGVTAHHRGDSFLACRYIIDNVKHRLPIWKHECYLDGTEAWIESHACGCSDPSNLNTSPHTVK